MLCLQPVLSSDRINAKKVMYVILLNFDILLDGKYTIFAKIVKSLITIPFIANNCRVSAVWKYNNRIISQIRHDAVAF